MDIFVGSLPFKLNESELKEMFEKYGEVASATIVLNKATRQNKGFGFVSMPDEKQAQTAIKELDGVEVQGRRILVSKSKEDKTTGDKNSGNSKIKTNENSVTWRKDFFRKKPKTSVVTYGDPEKNSGMSEKKPARVKKAKNFKVGARRKK